MSAEYGIATTTNARLLVISMGTLSLLVLTLASTHRFRNYASSNLIFSLGSTRPSRLMLDEGEVGRSCKGADGRERRVMVTGAAGFIGFHVAKALWKRGDGVVGFDNFNDYYPVSLKYARVEELRKIGVHVVHGDLVDQALLGRVVEVCGVTDIIHMAAQAGVRYAKLRPMSYTHSNVEGTVSLFEAARLAENPPRVIYASSSSVYGGNQKVPFSEEDRVDDPVSLYAATKRAVELTAGVYNKLYGISFTGLRFFTVYGPWGRPDMAYFSFARNIVQGKPVKIFVDDHDGQLARDFTFIDDIVDGVLGAMDTSKQSLPGLAENRIFNLGNTHAVPVNRFVELLEEALKMKAITSEVHLGNTGDVLITHANVSAAHNAFGYTPKTNLKHGLLEFAKWFFDYYGPDGLNLRDDEKNYTPY